MFSVYTFRERQLPNLKFRYEGSFYGVRYAIDSDVKRSKNEIEDFLDTMPTESLINAEGYVMDLR